MLAIVLSVISPRVLVSSTSSASGWRAAASSYRRRREVLWNSMGSDGSTGSAVSSASRTGCGEGGNAVAFTVTAPRRSKRDADPRRAVAP